MGRRKVENARIKFFEITFVLRTGYVFAKSTANWRKNRKMSRKARGRKCDWRGFVEFTHTAHTYQQMSSMALSLVEFGCASDIRFNLNWYLLEHSSYSFLTKLMHGACRKKSKYEFKSKMQRFQLKSVDCDSASNSTYACTMCTNHHRFIDGNNYGQIRLEWYHFQHTQIIIRKCWMCRAHHCTIYAERAYDGATEVKTIVFHQPREQKLISPRLLINRNTYVPSW